MEALGTLSVRTKLYAACLILFLALLGTSTLAFLELSYLDTAASDVGEKWLRSVDSLGRLNTAVIRHRTLQGNVSLSQDPAFRAEQMDRQVPVAAIIEQSWAAYLPLVRPGDEATKADALKSVIATYLTQSGQANASWRAGQHAAGSKIYDDNLAHYREAVAGISTLQDLNSTLGQAAIANAHATYASSVRMMALALGIGAIVAGLSAWWLDRSIVARVLTLAMAMRALCRRDYTVELDSAAPSDEIGDLTRAIHECRESLQEGDRLAAERAVLHEDATQRSERLKHLVLAFEAASQQTIGGFSTAAEQLHETASTLDNSAQQTFEKTESISCVATQTSKTVQTVAAAAEQLASSVHEIGVQVARSASVATAAVEDARRTDGVVQALSQSAQKINAVVQMISDIAGRTNLLALNATIEAARAGEAGKGFAVVASEVKSLAAQTASATDEVSSQITQIQTATNEAVAAIGGIAARINELSAIGHSIAAAVEEQGVATAEIASNVQRAASGTEGVTGTIRSVATAIGETGGIARSLLTASSELSRQGITLREQIGGFLTGVRTA